MTHLLLWVVLAQTASPEDEWVAPPSSVVTPREEASPAAPPDLTEGPAPQWAEPPPAWPEPPVRRSQVLQRVLPPVERNTISAFGASALPAGRRAQAAVLGFPLIDLRALFALGGRFDLGLGFNSYFFMMNEPKLLARFNFFDTGVVALGAAFEGGYAFFVQRAPVETRGARWLTGRRNVNLQPSLLLSIQPKARRAPRIFFDLHYLLTLDFEGYATTPLGGLPPDVIVGHNGGLRGGAELPLSASTSFMFSFGLDIQGREEDARMMPSIAVGLVTSI